jgi:hypothetical protein
VLVNSNWNRWSFVLIQGFCCEMKRSTWTLQIVIFHKPLVSTTSQIHSPIRPPDVCNWSTCLVSFNLSSFFYTRLLNITERLYSNGDPKHQHRGKRFQHRVRIASLAYNFVKTILLLQFLGNGSSTTTTSARVSATVTTQLQPTRPLPC